MRRVFIIRHGRTEWNRAQRLQGAGGDSPLLTDAASYQALAQYLDQYRFTQVVTSPLPRAQATATRVVAAMTQPLPPVRLDAAFTELSFGQWEGRARDELIAEAPALFAKLSAREDDPALAALGMENFQAARARFVAGLQRVVTALGPDENALVFTHGGIGQLGIKAATGNERLLGLKNLATSILGAVDGQFYLDVYNQTAYLKHVSLAEGNVSIL